MLFLFVTKLNELSILTKLPRTVTSNESSRRNRYNQNNFLRLDSLRLKNEMTSLLLYVFPKILIHHYKSLRNRFLSAVRNDMVPFPLRCKVK